MRYWDGTSWTDHTVPPAGPSPLPPPSDAAPAPPPPPSTAAPPSVAGGPQPPPPPPPGPGAAGTPGVDVSRHLRSDGRVKGPSALTAGITIAVGVVVGIVGLVQFVSGVIDGFEAHQLDTPTTARVDLDEGTWLVYERDDGFGTTLLPGDVTVRDPTGDRLLLSRPRFDETTTRGTVDYVAMARFDVTQSGLHEISIEAPGEFAGSGPEVLIGRSITDIFARWPWLIGAMVGGVILVVGIVLAVVGYSHRKAVRRARPAIP